MASGIDRDDESAVSLVTDESLRRIQDSKTKSHTKDVHILSLAFLLIFLAYGANLQSTLNTLLSFGYVDISWDKIFKPIMLRDLFSVANMFSNYVR
ncbi:hypothetical protein RIF29_00824 [Crotalaria pallida]|uniref:Uncharacterized protein n=1 Tax=Crotalaria pallida TaxID=3830 RepID=A0AAN9IW83_CROPI